MGPAGRQPGARRRCFRPDGNFLGITLSTTRIRGNARQPRRTVEKIGGICSLTLWLSTEISKIRHNFLLPDGRERSSIQSRDGQPQGSRSRGVGSLRAEDARAGEPDPSGKGSKAERPGGFGRQGREPGSLRASRRPESGPSGTRNGGAARKGEPAVQAFGPGPCGKPFGAGPQRRCQGALRSHAGTSASKHLAPSLRLGPVNRAPAPATSARTITAAHTVIRAKQNPAAPECSRVCCARECPRLSHLCGACLSTTGIFVNKILWCDQKYHQDFVTSAR